MNMAFAADEALDNQSTNQNDYTFHWRCLYTVAAQLWYHASGIMIWYSIQSLPVMPSTSVGSQKYKFGGSSVLFQKELIHKEMDVLCTRP